MNRLFLQPGCVLTLALVATPVLVAQAGELNRAASVSGLVRDSDGVPQMGARVDALLPDATVGATAVTDSHGLYHFLLPAGSYRIRATAALLMPAMRERLQVLSGSRAVVNLTLSTLLAPDGWLPVSRRTGSEPTDDWTWTLRSSAGRSILRLANDEESSSVDDQPSIAVSSSRQESRDGATGGSITLGGSDGGFARGGSHNILVLTHSNGDGSGTVVRADLSGTRSPYPVAPSADISAGLQRQTILNGRSRLVVSYSSHPELLDSRGSNGLQGATVRSGQRIELGDFLQVDVGNVLRNTTLHGNAFAMEPFLRAAVRPGTGIVIAYSLTRSQGTESLDDLDQAQAALPVAVFRSGHLRLEGGTHQAFTVEGALPGGGTAALVVYRDRMISPLVAGSGQLSSTEQRTDGLLADPTTRTFRVAAQDYSSSGVRIAYRHPLSKQLQAGAEFSSGESLRATSLRTSGMSDVLHGLTPTGSYAARVSLDGKLPRLGTTVRAGYRWQPAHTLTPVDAFHVGSDGAYLSCSIRQSLGKLHFVPRGLQALVDVENLLAEGYQPFVSSDGQTLYLAQTPRMLQAGLSFSF